MESFLILLHNHKLIQAFVSDCTEMSINAYFEPAEAIAVATNSSDLSKAEEVEITKQVNQV